MKYIDIKVTVWNRYTLPDTVQAEQVITFINEFGIDYLLDQINVFTGSKVLWGTHEPIPPDQNAGDATIVLYDEGTRVWQNGRSNR